MSFNFPSSPALNDQYAPVGGPTYTWDGVAWKAVVQGVPVTVYVSDTAPPQPAIGQLWWNSANGTMSIWYADADSAQWVQVSGAVSATPTAETRNRIINGAMQMSQENGDAAGAANGYWPADMWSTFNSTATVSANSQRFALVTPDGSSYRVRVTVTTGAGAGSGNLQCFHRIEGYNVADFDYGFASARQAVLRFGWRSPAGTYSVAIRNNAQDRSFLAPFTISAAQANTDTEQVIVIPGDVTGAWLITNGIGLNISFTLTGNTPGVPGWQSGSFLSLQNNTLATGAIFDLFDVGLYLDPLKTGVPPRWEMPVYADTLIACFRYWQTCWVAFFGNVTSAAGYWALGAIKATMRTTPAMTGVVNGATSFPNTIGTLAYVNNMVYDARNANATGPGNFNATLTLNARL